MADASVLDLRKLDREVARAFARLEAGEADPFLGLRHVAGHSTYVALGALAPSAQDFPLRDALRDWVYALTQARIGRDLEVARRDAAALPTGRFEGEVPRLVSFRDAWRGLIGARSTVEARLWRAAAEDAAPRVGSIAREGAVRRAEVAKRMGRSESRVSAVAAARALLDETEDVARATQKEANRRSGAAPEATILDAVARDAAEGWPARLTARWLGDVFGVLAKGLALRPRLPSTVLGASTFARAFYAFGVAHRLGCAAISGLPFALARAPSCERSHRHAFLVAALATNAQFHRHALHLSRDAAAAQARALSRTALLEARLSAARLLLTDVTAFAPDDLFEELSTRVLGAPLPRAFAGAWPAVRDDEPARFTALLAAVPFSRQLESRHDSDWWRNPRASADLRAHGALPERAAPGEDGDPAARVSILARAFEDGLG